MDTSPGKAVVEGKNVSQDSLNTLSQCVATTIIFAQLQRHPAIPMLRLDPEGVVVSVYDYPYDVLMISQHIPWGDVAFITVWSVLHYSLFHPPPPPP